MYCTPYTDELIAIAGAGMDLDLPPTQIFKIVSQHADKNDAERAARKYALDNLKQAGLIDEESPPKLDDYKPHTPFMLQATRKVWRDRIASADFVI